MAIGNHYKLKLSGNLLGQKAINVFWYRNDDSNSTATRLWDAFLINVVPQILYIVSDVLTLTNAEVVNMENAGDFKVASFSLNGARPSDCMTPFNAWGFELFPNSLAFKSGGKRFAGVCETDVSQGYPTGAQLAKLDDLALKLGASLVDGAARWKPNFFSKRCIKDPVTHKCTSTFVEAFGTFNAAVFDYVTSQSSRKFRTTP